MSSRVPFGRALMLGSALMALAISTGCVREETGPPRVQRAPEGSQIGQQPPDFRLEDPQGNVHRLSDYDDAIVVLDFWATWCAPCREAMGTINRVHLDYEGQGVHVIGMSFGEREDPAAYMKQRGFDYTLLLKANRVGRTMRVQAIPDVIVLDRGVVVDRITGAVPDLYSRLKKTIEKALEEREHGDGATQ